MIHSRNENPIFNFSLTQKLLTVDWINEKSRTCTLFHIQLSQTTLR